MEPDPEWIAKWLESAPESLLLASERQFYGKTPVAKAIRILKDPQSDSGLRAETAQMVSNAVKYIRSMRPFNPADPRWKLALDQWETPRKDGYGFSVVIDPGTATAEDIAEVFDAISELNRAVGGEGMIFVDAPEDSNVSAGEVA